MFGIIIIFNMGGAALPISYDIMILGNRLFVSIVYYWVSWY